MDSPRPAPLPPAEVDDVPWNRKRRRAADAVARREARKTGYVAGDRVVGWLGKDPVLETDVSSAPVGRST